MMMGSGTQTDPYIVDNWDDFVSVTNASTSAIYVKWADSDNKVINFNDIKPEGFDSSVYFPANVDFNGWTLKKFSSTAEKAIQYKDSAGIIENLILEDAYITSTYVFYGAWEFKKCQVSGRIHSNNLCYIFCAGGLSMCSVHFIVNIARQFKLLSAGSFISYKCWAKTSDIIIDLTTASKEVTISDTYLKNCRVSGRIQMGDAPYIFLGNSYSASNIINVQTSVPLRCGGYISVFNSEIASSDSFNDYFFPCTSEQLESAEYLSSIGFPIGVN